MILPFVISTLFIQPKIDKPTPVVTVQVVPQTPVQPVVAPPVTEADNPQHCDETHQWIASEAPFYCIEKGYSDVSSPAPRYGTSYNNTYDYGSCTWFVASVIRVPDDLGNANTWAVRASEEGFKVTPIPRVGAVAQTTAGYFGHVAEVVGVRDGEVMLREMNVTGWNVVDERWVPVGDYQYIYF